MTKSEANEERKLRLAQAMCGIAGGVDDPARYLDVWMATDLDVQANYLADAAEVIADHRHLLPYPDRAAEYETAVPDTSGIGFRLNATLPHGCTYAELLTYIIGTLPVTAQVCKAGDKGTVRSWNNTLLGHWKVGR